MDKQQEGGVNKRQQARAQTREKVLEAARRLFSQADYRAVGIRDIAAQIGLSTGAVFANFEGKGALWREAMGFPFPWRPIELAKKDGRLLVLLVDGREATNRAAVEAASAEGYLWMANGLEDAEITRTLGHNNFENDGEDRWQMAGWCWSQDHYTEGRGTPIAFVELDAVAPGVEP